MRTVSRFAARARCALSAGIGSVALCGALLSAGDLHASQETIDACEDAATLLRENDIDGALEEAGWCLEGIQQLKQQQTLAVFPDTVDGFEGGESSSQKAMGVKMIERSYSKGDESIDVTLVGGGPATAGLAALAQLGVSISNGGKKLRIQKRTVVDMSNGGSTELMVQLKSGGMLTIKSGNASRDSVVSFARAFPIRELDEALDER